MRIKEAIEILKKAPHFPHDKIGAKEAIDTAIEVMEKAEKYRWHNLRENPDDLPNAGQKVRVVLDCVTGKKNVIDGFLGYGDYTWYTSDVGYFNRKGSSSDNSIHEAYIVIAWREIETFEG